MERLIGQWLRQMLLIAALLAGGSVDVPQALAQHCSTDAQCGPSAGGYNVCLGDTLVLRRRLCVGGQCVEQETGRISCGGGGIGGTCQGNVYIGGGGSRCDALSGRCAPGGGGIRQTCTRSCSCVGRTLVVSTGQCSAGVGCVQITQRCKVGCTCAPDPRCTEEPARGQPRVAATGRKPAPKVNRLPMRMAEPFDRNASASPAADAESQPVNAVPAAKKKKRVRRAR